MVLTMVVETDLNWAVKWADWKDDGMVARLAVKMVGRWVVMLVG